MLSRRDLLSCWDMVLIQLLLPTSPARSDGPQRLAAALSQTRRELAEIFEGLTAYVRSPAKGVWTAVRALSIEMLDENAS